MEGTFYSSHDTVNLNMWEILKFFNLLKSDNELDNDSDNEELVQMPFDQI